MSKTWQLEYTQGPTQNGGVHAERDYKSQKVAITWPKGKTKKIDNKYQSSAGHNEE
jgi:hypothetical protein